MLLEQTHIGPIGTAPGSDALDMVSGASDMSSGIGNWYVSEASGVEACAFSHGERPNVMAAMLVAGLSALAPSANACEAFNAGFRSSLYATDFNRLPTKFRSRCASYRSSSEGVTLALSGLADEGVSKNVLRMVANLVALWEQELTSSPEIEDLGDGAVLMRVLPEEGALGVSIEIMPDTRLAFNIMTSEGDSLGYGVVEKDDQFSVFPKLLSIAEQSGEVI